MGHVYLPPLPKSKKLLAVVQLIRAGAGAPQAASATVDAIAKWFHAAGKDPGVVEAVRQLMLLPLAASEEDLGAALRGRGLDVPDSPGLIDIALAVSERIGQAMPSGSRTDIGEMAQAAAAETLTEVVGARFQGLFESTPEDVHHELSRLGSGLKFGPVASDFFARLSYRLIAFFLERTAPAQVGEGERFRTFGQHAEFDANLYEHCRHTARVVERFAPDWLSKEAWETGGEVSPAAAGRFTAYAMQKLTKVHRQEAEHGS